MIVCLIDYALFLFLSPTTFSVASVPLSLRCLSSLFLRHCYHLRSEIKVSRLSYSIDCLLYSLRFIRLGLSFDLCIVNFYNAIVDSIILHRVFFIVCFLVRTTDTATQSQLQSQPYTHYIYRIFRRFVNIPSNSSFSSIKTINILII